MTKSRRQKEGITGYGLKNQLSLFCMQESQVPNKKLLWQDKNNYSKTNIQKQRLSLTLPPASTKVDEVIKPFWSPLSTVIHNILWQPHQIELPEPAFNSSNGIEDKVFPLEKLYPRSLNYRVEVSNFWKKQIIPNNLTPKPLLLSLQASSTPTMESEAQVNVITSKKIRIYPKYETLWFDSLNLYRRAYNLTIEFRTQICDWCRIECEDNDVTFNCNLIQAAYRKACDTRTTVIKKRVNGEKAELSFMSRMAPHQYFVAPRLSAKKQIFPNILKGCTWTEKVPEDAIGKTVIVTYTNGQWFANVKFIQPIQQVATKKLSMVKKSDETRKRFIRRKTVRGMLGLAHYKFKQTLKWMAKKYGKTVVDVNESYTSKTMWNGSILKNLGGKASILFQGKRVNRDIHGARNILIRFLTKVIEILSPRGAYPLDITKAEFCGFGVFQ